MTKAMLLCAGKGTRLGLLGSQCPKPLMPVCDTPILRYGIANLVARGVEDIVINLHHRGDMIREELGDGSDLGARIQYSVENEILGTGGGLKHALHLLDPDGSDEPFVSLNGKLIFDIDVTALLKAFEHDKNNLGMMVVQPAPNAMKWGAVDVVSKNEELQVRNILGEGGYMFCGVHVTRPSTVARLPEGEACMVRQGYLPWIQKGEKVTAYVHQGGYFAEHSTPKRYLQSSIDLLQGALLSHPPGPMLGIDQSAQVHPSAKIFEPVLIGPGAEIGEDCHVGPNAVIGRMAKLPAGHRVEESIVWQHTEVKQDLKRAIATPGGVVDATGGDEVDS